MSLRAVFRNCATAQLRCGDVRGTAKTRAASLGRRCRDRAWGSRDGFLKPSIFGYR
jgi:hypothetical protein